MIVLEVVASEEVVLVEAVVLVAVVASAAAAGDSAAVEPPGVGDMRMARFIRHLTSGPWALRRHLPGKAMHAIRDAIATSEQTHLGELRFAIEASLGWGQLLRGLTPRQRAIQVFSQLRVWDTEQNSGVLIYLLLADRAVEIVADRGIHARVGEQVWCDICRVMEKHFREGDFEQGALEGIRAITTQLQEHFPSHHNPNPNELPDAPVVL